jgi:hypothetical protein
MNISTRSARPWFAHPNYPGEKAFIGDPPHILFFWTLALLVHRC